jgi:hypothetical protein
MTKAEEYRERAREADEAAEQSRDLLAKQMYRQVAQNWRDMANQAERNGW